MTHVILLDVWAPGAIFGVGGAMAVFFIRHRDAFGPASKSILQSLAQSLLLNVAFGLTSSQIDNWCVVVGWELLHKPEACSMLTSPQ